ncbi:MAG: RHS repeat-associated core domain-containing protein [Acidimicrobiales bacterium]
MRARVITALVVSAVLAAMLVRSGPELPGVQLVANPNDLLIQTFAGDGTSGYSGDRGAATAAEISGSLVGNGICGGDTIAAIRRHAVRQDEPPELYENPFCPGQDGVASDSAGDVAIADTMNNVIRFVPPATGTYFGQSMTAGDIYTIAGDGTAGYTGDGGLGTSAELDDPTYVAFDGAGNLYISDSGNNEVRFLAESTGDISTIAGSATGVSGDSGNGGAATSAYLYDPGGLTVDPWGDVVVADSANFQIRVIAGTSGTRYGLALTAGDIYALPTQLPEWYFSVTGDDYPSSPSAVSSDAAGNLFVTDPDGWLYEINEAGTGSAIGTQLSSALYGVAVDAEDNLFVVEGNERPGGDYVYEYPDGGSSFVLAGTGTYGYNGDDRAPNAAELNYAGGVAVDPGGDLLIGDAGNARVRIIPGAASGAPAGGSCGGSETFGTTNEAESSCTAAESITNIGPESGSVSTLTGDFTLSLGQFSLAGPGGPLSVSETYNSLAAGNSGPLGPGWSLSPSETLSVASRTGQATITEGDGATVSFLPQASSAPYCPAGDDQDPPGPAPGGETYYCAPERVEATLVYNGTDFVYDLDNLTTVQFDPSASSSLFLIASSTDANANTTSFSWTTTTSPPQLNSISNAAGRSVSLLYYTSGPSTGLLQSITDHQLSARQVSFAYSSGDLQSITDPDGNVTSFGYSGTPAELTSIVSPKDQSSGAQTTIGYVPGNPGVVAQASDPMSPANTWTFAYAGSNTSLLGGNVTVTDPHRNQVFNAYNFGELDSSTTGFGTSASQTTRLEYDPVTTLPTTVIGPQGQTWSYSYTPAGDLWCASTPNEVAAGVTCPAYPATPPAGTTAYTYNTSNQVLTVTPPTGAETENTYNDLNDNVNVGANNGADITSSTVEGGGRAPSLDTQYDYCSTCGFQGLVSSVETPDGATTYYTYDSSGDTASVATEPSATMDTTKYTYDPDGETWCSASPDATAASVTCTAYPTVPPADTTAYTHDNDGNVLTTTDPEGNVTTDKYDADGNLYEVIAPGTSSPNTTETTYTTFDNDDRPTAVTTGYGTSAAATTDDAYDIAYGTSPCSATVTGAKYCEAVEEPDGVNAGSGYLTVDYYDASNREIEVTDAGSGVSTSYAYDEAVGSGACTSMPSSTIYCDVATNLGNSDATTTASDGDGNTTGISYSTGSPQPVSYTYDALDRRTSMTQGSGSSVNTTDYSYDSDGRETLVSYTPAGGSTTKTSYGYDGDGDVTCMSYPVATTQCSDAGNTTGTGLVDYTYDGANRMKTLEDWNSETTSFTTYDADDNLKTTSLPNGDSISSGFDNDDGITSSAVSGTSNAPSWSDTRYPNESLRAETDAGALNASASFAYDARNEVSSDNSASFTYDKDANPATFENGVTQSVASGTDRLGAMSVGAYSASYGYDDFGDRTSDTTNTGPSITYSYNQASELTSVAPSGVSPDTVSIASDHSLFVLPTDAVQAAGSDTSGQLGNGTTSSTPYSTPVGVLFTGGSPKIVQVAAGVGFSIALDSSGNIWTWGFNTDGELGCGSCASSDTGKELPSGSFPSGVTIKSIAAGDNFAVAVGSNGKAYSWGQNNADQLGDGSHGGDSTTPVAVSTVTGVVEVGAGVNYGAALTSTGKVYTWGYNSFGQLGNGGTTEEDTPGLVESGVATMAVGDLNVITMATTTNVLHAWGTNVTGEVGDGTTTGPDTCGSSGACAWSPVAVGNGTTPVTAVSIAEGDNTGYAISTSGQLYAWGASGYGQFGNGGDSPSDLPIDIGAGDAWVTSSASAKSAISVSQSGAVAVWGDNTDDELGCGACSNTLSPIELSGMDSAATAAGSASYTYDGNGLRMSETTVSGTENFTWNTASSVPELLSDGSNDYVYGPGGLPIEQITPSGTDYFFHDALGSTRALLSSSGAVVATYAYDAYGALSEATVDSAATPLLFGGQYYDAASNLYYLVNRYYDPTTGQLLTVDPKVATTGQAYAYAGSDPIDGDDPSGLVFGEPGPDGGGGEIGSANGEDGLFEWGADAECDTYACALDPTPISSDNPEQELSAAEKARAYEGSVAAEGETAAGGVSSVDDVQQMLSNLQPGRNPGVWTVNSDQELNQVFDELTENGSPTTWKGYDGSVYELPDGTQVGLRGSSSTGGATIDIRTSAGDQWKIHIR